MSGPLRRPAAKRLDRRALFATGSAAALLAAVGVSAEAAPARGGHLRVALSGGARGETLLTAPGGTFSQAVRNAVFETLTEVAADGTLRPCLATAWRVQENAATWVLTLRSDVRFHDGTALRFADIAASLARVPSVVSVERGAARGEVIISLAAPDADFPFTLADGAYPIYSASELETGTAPRFGTGLYRIVRLDPGRGFLGQRVEGHRRDGDAGWFETVELVSMSDEAVRAEAVRDGYVDAAEVSAAFDLGGRSDVTLLTDAAGSVRGAYRVGVNHGPRLGPHPLDAMRFATRWWMTA